MTTLSPDQQQQVESWAAEGASLNDIQNRLKAEFGITLTYLDARMLLMDAGVKLLDKVKPAEASAPPEAQAPPASPPSAQDWAAAPAAGGVSVTADPTPIPGAMASGKATFSDGKSATWYVDQMGRLGLRAPEPGYQPPPGDIAPFEEQLDALLSGL